MMKVLPEFTKQTGIEVEVDQLQYLKMRERQTLELTTDEGDYDLISYVVFSKADYVFADQLENLARYFMNPKLSDQNYDAADLIDGYVANIGIAGGKKGYLPGATGSLFGIPYGSETSVLAYRKDIFEKHGIATPETYDQLLDAACKIPKNAQNKEAAFLLMQWLTLKEGDLATAMAGGNPSRFSTYQNAELNAKYPYSATLGEALKYADPDWRPIIPTWGKINADIGTTMSQVLTEGLDPQTALDGVAERAKAIMEEAGYYTWN